MTETDMIRVLAVFGDCDCHDSLTWHVSEGAASFAATCSDLFYWATADAEPITADDLPLLEACAADLKALGDDFSDIYLPELYASRKRGMRPMIQFMNGNGQTGDHVARHALFAACGPERPLGAEDEIWSAIE